MGSATLQLQSYFGPYFLEKLIAIGGMAEIYLASARGLAGFEKQLVLKVIQPDMAGNEQFVQMLVNEAKLAVGLNHPNIAQTFDLGKIGESYFISMEYVDGADFFQVLKKLTEMDADLPLEAALFVVHEALCGLDYAHNKRDEQGQPLRIIHRDVSPQNILLSRHGEVKLVDFGIAKAANLSHKTRAGVIKGKLVYMSPEQAWGEAIDRRSDVFSAGIVLYEALTMGSLHVEKNPAHLLEKVRNADIDPPSSRRPDLPRELDELVMKAVARDPAARFQSGHEFAEALSRHLQRTAPDYTELNLGALVEAVLAGQKPEPRQQAAPAPSRRDSASMDRDDFAMHGHSMIFSAAEMLAESSPQLPGRAELEEGAPPHARLVPVEGDDPPACDLTDRFILGRAGDMRLGDARVSRRHAEVSRQGADYLVQDLGSSNGTYVNDVKLDGPHVLQHGDVIRIGPFKMRFVVARGAELPSTGPSPTREPRHTPRPVPSMGQSTKGDASLPTDAPGLAPDGAAVAMVVGSETMVLPVGERLELGHSLEVGDSELHGSGAALVRRSGGYWLEPAPGTDAVFHNGHPVSAPIQLVAGDKLRVGPIHLEFRTE